MATTSDGNVNDSASLVDGNAASPELANYQHHHQQQHVHHPQKPATKQRRAQFTSCDACRLRKTRCIRDGQSMACQGCMSRGIVCTNAFLNHQPVSKGKRIDLCRQKYGSTTIYPNSKTATAEPSAAGALAIVRASKVMHPMADDMNGLALSSNALERFLDYYKSAVHDDMPCLSLERLVDACKAVDFNFNKLDDEDKILCFCASAAATSVSGHGPGAIVSAKDPLVASRSMIGQTIELVDRYGLIRKPSGRSVQALRILQMLTSGDDAKEHRRSHTYKAFEQAFVNHLRVTVENGETPLEAGFVQFWSSIIGDSFGAALSGQPPSYSDEDYEIFAPYLDLSTTVLLKLISECNLHNIEIGYGLLFGHLCTLARNFYKRVSSASARRRPMIDLDMIQEIGPEVDGLASMLEVYEQRLNVLLGVKWPDKLVHCSKVMRFLFTYLDTMALNAMEQGIIREVSGGATSPARLARLLETQKSIQIRCAKGFKENSAFLGSDTQKRIVGAVDALLSYMAVVRYRCVLKLPSYEETDWSGTGVWTLKDKMRCAQDYYRVCEALGRSVLAVRDELPALKKEVDDFLARAEELLASSTYCDTSRLIPNQSASTATTAALFSLSPYDLHGGVSGQDSILSAEELLGTPHPVPPVPYPLTVDGVQVSNVATTLHAVTGVDAPAIADSHVPDGLKQEPASATLDFDFDAMQQFLDLETFGSSSIPSSGF